MFKRLLILSLVAIPFYEVFLYFLIPGRVFPLFPDMRITKDFMAMGFASGIGSVVLYKYGFKRFSNVWMPIFLTFLVWNMAKAPGFFIVSGVNFSGLWNYKSAYQLFVYFFLLLGIINIPDLPIKDIFKTIAYCGLAMAAIMLLQRAGFEQVFSQHSEEIMGATKLPEMGGTLGQATLSAPFILMCLPFMLNERKWLFSAVMGVSVFLSGSSVAVVGLCVVLFMMAAMTFTARWQVITVVSLMIFLFLGMFLYLNSDFFVDNGRFGMWADVWKDILKGKIAYTGAGIGAFKYLFAIKNGNTWYHAHNEYLQLVWSCGLIGTGIAIMAVKDFLFRILNDLTQQNKAILASFVGIGVISGGTFPLQLAAYQYYLIVMAGIIYRQKNGGL